MMRRYSSTSDRRHCPGDGSTAPFFPLLLACSLAQLFSRSARVPHPILGWGTYATNVRSFQPGIATVDGFASSGGSSTKYYHADMIGTTRSLTAGGSPTGGSVYTAFGELVSGTNHRYGYAGAWQYQAHGEFPFLHLGHRYYDPGSGRFLQRDPIGIASGLNSYVYASGNPLLFVDPDGLINDNSLAPPGRGYPGDPPVFSNTDFLDITGGRGRTFLDRWGDYVDQHGSSGWFKGPAFGGARVPKGMQIPGTKPGSTSIWTKVPGIAPYFGKWMGRFFLPITLTCGAYDTYVIIRGAYEAW